MGKPEKESGRGREWETAAGEIWAEEPACRRTEIHELRRARRTSEEAPSPPAADSPRRGGGAGETERAKEAPPPPAPSPGSEGEEEAIARYIFSIPAEEYWPSTSAYV